MSKQTFVRCVEFILANVPTNLYLKDLDRKKSIVEDTDPEPYGGVHYFEFRTPDDKCEATLTLKNVKDYESIVRDEHENDVWQSTLITAVSWPSYSSSGADLSMRRAEVIFAVCELAKFIEAEYGQPETVIHRTKAEREERQAKALEAQNERQAQNERERQESLVRNAVHAASDYMRVGHSKDIQAPACNEGEYTIGIGAANGKVKQFKARVKFGTLYFERIA